MRTRMNEDRLNVLVLIHFLRDIEVNIDDVISRFAKNKNRRIEFLDYVERWSEVLFSHVICYFICIGSFYFCYI
jgi:hypothetical protein